MTPIRTTVGFVATRADSETTECWLALAALGWAAYLALTPHAFLLAHYPGVLGTVPCWVWSALLGVSGAATLVGISLHRWRLRRWGTLAAFTLWSFAAMASGAEHGPGFAMLAVANGWAYVRLRSGRTA